MRTKLKRLLAGFLAAVITVSVLPLQALAAEFTAGQIVQTYIGDVYQGSDDGLFDDKLFHDMQSFNYLIYPENGDPEVGYRVQANHSKLYIKNGSDTQQVICIEAGVDYTANKNYKGYDESTDNYMNRLSKATQDYIKKVIFCGYNDKRSKMPISSASYFKFSNHTYNEDDFAFATQVLVWEFQQGLRTDTTRGSSTLKTNDAGTPPTVFYDQLKGRPAEDCYNYILTEMAKYDNKIPSFANEDEDKATTYKMVYNTTTKKYSVTLTDTKNTGVSASYFSLSGVTVTKSGNKYTFTTSNKIATAKTCFGEESVCAGEDNMLIWRVSNSDERKQTIATGIEDPTESYIKLITEDRADASVQKTFDNDSELTAAEKEELFSHISFTIKDKSSGKYITATGSAGSYTYSGTSTSATYYKPDTTGKFVVKNMPIDTYTLTEYNSPPDYTPTVKSKDFTTVAGQTAPVSFENKRDTGDGRVAKLWISSDTLTTAEKAALGEYVYFTVKKVGGNYVTATGGTGGVYTYSGTSTTAQQYKLNGTSIAFRINEMPTGFYTITEYNNAPNYYPKQQSKTIEVVKDETATATFTNKANSTLVIRKKLSDEASLSDDERLAEYDLISFKIKCVSPDTHYGYNMILTETEAGKYKFSSLMPSNMSSGTVLKLDENGEIQITFGQFSIDYTFEIEEIYAGTDYEPDGPKQFTVTATTNATEVAELPDIVFENKLKTGKVEITKEFLNVEGNSETVTDEQLSEISFVIRNEDGKLLNFSGSNGMYSYTGVGTGTRLKLSDTYKLTADSLPSRKQYTIEEVSGTDGYSFTVDPVTFEITPDGTAQKVFYNKAQTGYLTIKKNSVDGKLSGWKFRVELVSSPFATYTYDETFTTDTNGVISIGNLRVGTYKVTEVTSGTTAGYITPESQIIEIDDNQLTNVTMENIPFGNIKIQKVNKKTGEKVSGATFAIYESNGNTPAKAFKSATDKTLVNAVIKESPAGSGIYVCDYLPITSEDGTKYVIEEISAPEGYILDGGSYTVTLVDAGETEFVSNNGTDQFEEDEYGFAKIIKKWISPDVLTAEDIAELEKNVYFTVMDKDNNYLKASGSNGVYTYSGTVGKTVTESSKFSLKDSVFDISKLPTGKYTVTEYNSAPGYSPATQSATLTVERNQTGYASFENKRDTGNGEINKNWVTPDNLTASEIADLESKVYFTVKVGNQYLVANGNNGVYTYAGLQDAESKFTLLNSKFVIKGMPTDVTYTVTEYNNAEGYEPDVQSESFVIANKGDTHTVNFTNKRELGNGEINKNWVTPDNLTAEEIADLESKVYFTVKVGNKYLKVSGSNGVYTYTGLQDTETKFMLLNSKFVIKDMPTGVTYTVTEYNDAEGYEPAVQSESFTIVNKGDTHTVNFTNKRELGNGEINKNWVTPDSLTPEEIRDLESKVYFTIKVGNKYLVANGNNGVYTYSGLQDAESKFTLLNSKFVIEGMPIGVTYTVTEYNNAEGYEPDVQSESFTIVNKGDTHTVNFTNKRELGNGEIRKSWITPDSLTPEEIAELESKVYFTVKVGNKYLKVSNAINGEYTYIGLQDEEARFMLINSKFVIKDMPAGVTYTITEYNNAEGYSPDVQSATLNVKKNFTSIADFENKRDTGNCEIDKNWVTPDNLTAEEIADLESKVYFTVKIGDKYLKASGNNGVYTYVGLQDEEARFMLLDSKFVIKDMPTGVTYTVTEYNNAEGYEPAVQSESFTIVNKDDTHTVEFTNERRIGDAEITKNWVTPDNLTAEEIADLESKVYFTVMVGNKYLKVSGADGVYTYVGVQDEETRFTLLDSKFVIKDMPTGVAYTVTEYNNAEGYEPAVQSKSFTIVEDEIYTVEFTNERRIGDAEITKNWVTPDNLTAEEIADLESKVYFTVMVGNKYLKVSGADGVYTYVGVQDEETRFTLLDSKFVIKDMPTGVTYTVTEYNNAEDYEPAVQSESFTIVEDEIYTVKFINKRKLGAGAVTKNWVTPNNLTPDEIRELESKVYFSVKCGDKYLKVNGSDGRYTYDGLQDEEAMFVLFNSKFIIEGMPTGFYTFTEINDAEGYLPKMQSVDVEIKENETTSVEFVNEMILGNLVLNKVDADSKNVYLGGAEYMVYVDVNKNGTYEAEIDTEYKKLIDNGGIYSLADVPYGMYLVKEIKAPEGYLIDENYYPVFIDTPEENENVSNTDENDVFVEEAIKGNVTITKVDEDYPDVKLTGAEFTIFALDKETVIGIMTEVEEGVYLYEGLRSGGYYVQETKAPEYFIRDVNFYYFEIVNNGETVTVSNDEIGKGTFINSPQKGEIKIIKTSYDNEVEGIKFKVTGTEFVGNKPYEQTFVTDENGEIHITDLRAGNYVVSEIESEELLEKYILADDVQLTINKNGQKAVVPMFNGQRSSSNPETGIQLGGTNNPTMPILFVSVALSILSGTIILIAPFKKRRNNK